MTTSTDMSLEDAVKLSREAAAYLKSEAGWTDMPELQEALIKDAQAIAMVLAALPSEQSLKEREVAAYNDGVIYAAGWLAQWANQDGAATEILATIGITSLKELLESGAPEYDIEACRRLFYWEQS
jgi:hypothetical protein